VSLIQGIQTKGFEDWEWGCHIYCRPSPSSVRSMATLKNMYPFAPADGPALSMLHHPVRHRDRQTDRQKKSAGQIFCRHQIP